MTVTPGSTAFCWSITRPRSSPVPCCAAAGTIAINDMTLAATKTEISRRRRFLRVNRVPGTQADDARLGQVYTKSKKTMKLALLNGGCHWLSTVAGRFGKEKQAGSKRPEGRPRVDTEIEGKS